MARLPWQHIYLGSASFAFALALAIVGIAMNVQSLVWVIVLFGAAGILTIVSLLTFVLGARSWVKRVLEELERAQDAAVQAYQDYVGEWILDENKPLTTAPPEDRRLTMVRERTLTVLARLGPKGKREVLRFLQNQDLIKREGTVIPLNGADLSGASLTDMNLLFANLTAVNLKGADLSGAHLSTVMGGSVDLAKAQEQNVYPFDLARPTAASWLEFANLSGTNLKGAMLAGCNLIGAKFQGAKLDEADIRGSDLRSTEGLTQKQIERAYGGVGQQNPAQETLLPDHLQAPAAWHKPLHGQKRDRERRAMRRLARLLRLSAVSCEP